MSPSGSPPPRDHRRLKAERSVFFTDAVVAIAQTLLILPLMESVAEAARAHVSTGEWLNEHASQVLSFVLSFVVISGFWLQHHRIFEHVDHTDGVLRLLNSGWMFTIVVLPVVTALTGGLATDALQTSLYIGSMFASACFLGAISWWLSRNPDLCEPGLAITRVQAVSTSLPAVLFAISWVVAVTVPSIGLFALLLMTLTGPVIRVIRRRATRH